MNPLEPLELAPLPSPREMSEWDRRTIAAGTSSLELMERAGRGVVDRLTTTRSIPLTSSIVVLVGPGNNGGDGLVVARLLRERGASVAVIMAGAGRYSDDFVTNGKKFVAMGESILILSQDGAAPPFPVNSVSAAEVGERVAAAAVIVDALLGTGQRAAPQGALAALIESLGRRSAEAFVLSVDIPSGVDGDSGSVYAPAVRADLTVAIQCVKRGLTQFPARDLCGSIETIDIGITPDSSCEFTLLGERCAVLPRRRGDAHKGDFGHVLVVGGSAAMPGAPVLAGRAALRLGAGWVSLVQPVLYPLEPELMRVPIHEYKDGQLHAQDLPALAPALKRASALVVGPGLGTGRGVAELLVGIVEAVAQAEIPTVLDADGLNIVASDQSRFSQANSGRFILTPHPGEAGRLLGCNSSDVQGDRFGAARELSTRFGCVVVLKGAGTIVYGGGRGYVCPFGTPYLGIPGSGDVLAGFIGALLAQGYSPIDAACRAVVIHALTGTHIHEVRGGYLVASDIIDGVGRTVSFK
jgi:hydroxyethylthiazole kinase-like uncharacterized protein yjeF